MATARTLIADVRRNIQDPSYSDNDILDLINQGVNEIAAHPLVKLPDLEDYDTVDTATDASYVALPSDYLKDLFYCYNNDQNWRIKVYPSLGTLQRKFSKLDQSGAIVGVAVKGSNLHYQRIPSSSEELQLQFYREPTDMDELADTPDGIPSHLQRSLLVNFAAKEIWSAIEQDMTGAAVNTAKYETRFEKALQALIGFIGPVMNTLKEIQQEIDWEDYL